MQYETVNETMINIYSIYASSDEESREQLDIIINELKKIDDLEAFTSKLNNICNKFLVDELNKKDGKNKYTFFEKEINQDRKEIVKNMEIAVLTSLYVHEEIDNLDHKKVCWTHGILNGVLYCHVKTEYNFDNSLEYVMESGKLIKNIYWSRFN